MKFNKFLLKDIASVQTGPFGSQLHKSDYVDDGTPIITVEHLGENKILHNNLPGVKDSDVDRLKKYIIKKNDIVFSRVGSVDRRALVSEKEDGWLFSGRCLRVRVEKEFVNPVYLSYYFGLPSFKEYIRGIAVGATMPSINTKILSNIEVYLPEKHIQDKIAEILLAFDSKIWINEEIIFNLEQLAQTVFKRWFIDFEFPNEDNEPYKTSGGSFIETELGLIPLQWEVGTFEKLGDIVAGGTPSKKKEEYYTTNGIPWITPKDLSNNKTIFIKKGEIDITEEGLKKSSAKLMPTGTVLFSSRAPIGYIAISGNEVTTNQGFKSIVPKKGYPKEFIFFLLKHLTPLIELNAGGSTFKEISGSGMKSIKCLIPSKNVLNLFEKLVRPLFEKIRVVEEESKTLEELRDALLPKLLSGEIELPSESEEKAHVQI